MTNTPKPKPIRVSVSQIRKYKRCARAWWYEYGPLGLKSPAKPSAQLGTQVHDILEKYLLEGTEPPATKAGRIASCGLDKLPDPAGLDIERSITLPLNDDANILCRIDMLGTDRAYIGDHKTTSDFKWAKTRAELDTDVQLLTYAYAAYHETKPENVEAELIYYRTRGLPVSMSVKTVLDWNSIEQNWAEMGELAREMAPKKACSTGESTTPNPKACGDYGGCYHADRCPFSPKNKNAFDNVLTCDNTEPVADAAQPKKDREMTKQGKTIQSIFGIAPPEAKTETAPTQTAPTQKDEIAEKMAEAGLYIDDDGKLRSIHANPPAAEAPTEPVKAPAAFQAKRKKQCTVDDLRNAADEIRNEILAAGMMKKQAVEEKLADFIAPSNVTDSRWSRFCNFLELKLDGDWFHAPEKDDDPTEEPDEKTTEAPAPVRQQKAAAIDAPFVVMVDAGFGANSPANAVTFSNFAAPYVAKLEAIENRPFYELDADYAKGSKLLAGVMTAAFRQDRPQGLVVANSGDGVFRTVLPVLERAGALVIYGRR